MYKIIYKIVNIKTASNEFQGISGGSGCQATDGILIPDTDLVLVGAAICWENRDVYYLSLQELDHPGTITTCKIFMVLQKISNII